MRKLDFDQALQLLADERPVNANEVRAEALNRSLYLMMYSAPGCLADHSEVCRTRADALGTARLLYADDAPRGFMAALRRADIAPTDDAGYYRVEIRKLRLRDVL